MQVRVVARGCAARVDDDDGRSARGARRNKPAIENGMTPGSVAADKHDEIGLVDISVTAWHDIFTEGADVPGDRGGHAETRIGVDIRRAEKTFHELVGDVIILGEELSG